MSAYSGRTRKLILAFDIGTTFSGISYCILDPGEVPEIKGVTRFPYQELAGGDCKIPTIIYYDQQGKVCAIGAQAVREGIDEEAEDGKWTKAEWFKLHLSPKNPSTAHVASQIPALPRGKTIIELFADFLRYLHQCVRTYIEETHAAGEILWRNLESCTEFVLTHPNGWEGAQQSQMRAAAVMAGLISDDEAGHSRLSFVTEGEASLHFCIQNGLVNDAIKSGDGLLIVDAGGGTIDISAYRKILGTSQSFEEIAAPQCHLQGSVFVTKRARHFLAGLLGKSRFAVDIPLIEKCFDKVTKLSFRNAEEPQFVRFGTTRDTDANLKIRSGQLRLLGSDVASFFDPSFQCIVKAINEQKAASATNCKISSIFLVGGFAANNWLFAKLKSTFSAKGIDVSRPDRHINKTVPDGAIAFYIGHCVTARVSKFTYGVKSASQFFPWIPDHIRRQKDVTLSIAGHLVIDGCFSIILRKDTRVSETQEFKQTFSRRVPEKLRLDKLDVPILCYRGKNKNPEWLDEDPSMYSTLCYIKADTAKLCESLEPQVGLMTYYQMSFDVVLSLGLTELKAYVCWMEDGVQKRTPAQVIYDYEQKDT
ncbi:hypothetical protein BYT27DRAFT_7260908 [Phlegmacium glaucopus]|nr:hypothetical protein BYT27DRAFT_7260908 [Phlegmacium glaucopus]